MFLDLVSIKHCGKRSYLETCLTANMYEQITSNALEGFKNIFLNILAIEENFKRNNYFCKFCKYAYVL